MEEKEISYINAVPLVDVMLVLLTIALTTATFIQHGALSVDLPSANAQNREVAKAIHLTITKNRTFFVEKREVAQSQIVTALAGFSRESLCEIYADRSVTIDDVTNLMSLLQENGFSKVVIKTQKRSDKAA